MTGLIIGGALLTLAGAAPVFLGLLFVVASSGNGSRLISGIIMLAGGAVLLFFGLRLLRKGIKSAPAAVRRMVLACAAKHNGLISAEALFAETGDREHTEQELKILAGEGKVKTAGDGGKTMYQFPEFQFQLKMKVCPYCGKDIPVRAAVDTCPSCGGDLKIRSMKTADGEDKFSLDE